MLVNIMVLMGRWKIIGSWDLLFWRELTGVVAPAVVWSERSCAKQQNHYSLDTYVPYAVYVCHELHGYGLGLQRG